MSKIFDKMASLSGFLKDDFGGFFATASDHSPAEVGAVLGYLLGRLDSQDATAMVSVLRSIQPQREVLPGDGRRTVNMVGTGGGPSTFNITTTSSFVVAAAGAVVIKTGSAACRSKSGFADVAAKLGTLKVSMPWEHIEAIAADVGIVFVPPSYHAADVGRLVATLTPAAYRNAAAYLNKIGPLLSPVKVDHQIIGANSLSCLKMLEGACLLLGDVPATLLAADDGMDEASTLAKTQRVELTADGVRRATTIDPAQLGIAPPTLADLQGFEPAAAAECCERILGGHGSPAQNDIVALNAGVVLNSIGLSSDLAHGVERARQILADGQGLEKLQQLRARVWKCVKR